MYNCPGASGEEGCQPAWLGPKAGAAQPGAASMLSVTQPGGRAVAPRCDLPACLTHATCVPLPACRLSSSWVSCCSSKLAGCLVPLTLSVSDRLLHVAYSTTDGNHQLGKSLTVVVYSRRDPHQRMLRSSQPRWGVHEGGVNTGAHSQLCSATAVGCAGAGTYAPLPRQLCPHRAQEPSTELRWTPRRSLRGAWEPRCRWGDTEGAAHGEAAAVTAGDLHRPTHLLFSGAPPHARPCRLQARGRTVSWSLELGGHTRLAQ